MWTPRRVLLFLIGLVGFGAAYVGYVRVLGKFDGLPFLPEKFYPPLPGESPDINPNLDSKNKESSTITKLKMAFGSDCLEQHRTLYPLAFENLQDGLVYASGTFPPIKESTQYLKLSPFSVAFYGKPPSSQELQAGEMVEITTIHADEAIMQLERPVKDTKDLLGSAIAIIGMELRISADNRYNNDRRAGKILIKNNQRSSDPNRALEFKTVGPLFYRSPNHPEIKNSNAPHIWTAAPVEIVNRENLPRPLRSTSLQPVPTRFEGGMQEASQAITDMALGLRSPPVTVTADGMKIYLKKAEPRPASANAEKGKGGSTFSGMRELVLSENVVFHLWTDSQGGFPGGSELKEQSTKVAVDAPLAANAILGGFADGVTMQNRLQQKSLLLIRTLGPFQYDMEKNLARFDIAPQLKSPLPNNVELMRFHPINGQDLLTCQQLDIEFFGSALQSSPKPQKTQAKKPANGQNAQTGAQPTAFKRMLATGSYVYLAAAAEQLEAQGTSIEYVAQPERNGTRTVLKGAPLLVLKQHNRLESGYAAKPNLPALEGQLVMESFEVAGAAGKPPTKKSSLEVFGRGRVELYDSVTRKPNMTARWQESLSQSKDFLGDQEVDLLVFNGKAAFEEPNGSFQLNADTLKLWLGNGRKTPGAAKGSASPLPERLQGLGHVEGHSTDAIIRDTDLLNIWFRDSDRSIRIEATPAPLMVRGPEATPAPAPQTAMKPATPTAPPPLPFLEPVATIPPRDNPLVISSRSVDMTMSRYPNKGDKKDPNTKPGMGDSGLSYELAKATCDGRVIVHQDPTEPLKQPRGTDITGQKLIMDNEPLGYKLNVFGTNDLLATVQFENVFIAGPDVIIDQPNNRVHVEGRGRLRMPSSSDMAGGNVNEPTEMVIDWLTRMDFRGEKRTAHFVGQVQAVQRKAEEPAKAGDPKSEPSWSWTRVVCHLLDVNFDRPVYFNQLKRSENRNTRTAAKTDINGPGKPSDDPKIEQVTCSPIPADQLTPDQQSSNRVTFLDETYSKRTGKRIKAQAITSRFLIMDTKDERTTIKATGPGTTRTLQLGSNDVQPTVAANGQKTATQQPPKEEMKLTIVDFNEELDIKDQKGILQEAKYRGYVVSYNIPTEDLSYQPVSRSLPPRSIYLQCNDHLIVSSYKSKGSEESERKMRAVGEATVRTDDYEGLGSAIDYDGTMLSLSAYPGRQATMYKVESSTNYRDFQKGDPLKYNTKTGQFAGDQSFGGEFNAPPRKP